MISLLLHACTHTRCFVCSKQCSAKTCITAIIMQKHAEGYKTTSAGVKCVSCGWEILLRINVTIKRTCMWYDNVDYHFCFNCSNSILWVYECTKVNTSNLQWSPITGSGAEPLAVVLLACLSQAVNDQLRIFCDFSVLPTLMTVEFIIPCSL